MNDRSQLFSRFHLGDTLRESLSSLQNRISGEPRDYILTVNEEEYITYIISEYLITPLSIDTTKTEIVAQFEKEVPIQDFGRLIHAKVNFLTFAIPFTGERELFFQQPNQFNFNPPRAEIKDSELHVTLRNEGSPENIKQSLDQLLRSIEQYIQWQFGEIGPFNAGLPNVVREQFRIRKEKFLADAGVVESLGFPLRKRAGLPDSYTVPIRKKIELVKPAAQSGQPYVPHPTMDDKTYDDILAALRNMALVMERTPSAFKELGEEGIRTHFLVQLNGSYEGDATGETFNHDGKTDILLRKEGKNLFIAECKFWTGPKGFTSTVDQLLNYLTWRDTKAAVLIFCRDTAISTVLEKYPEELKSHPNFVREIPTQQQGEFRAVMKSARDNSLSLILTVQVYDIPAA